MARISRTYALPPPRHRIERVRCCTCGRTWGVYEGRIPRMWNVYAGDIFCDRRPCNAAFDQARKMAKAG